MLKKTLVLSVVVALLVGVLVMPASALVVRDNFIWWRDGIVDFDDGYYQHYRLDIPMEYFRIHVINNSTSVGQSTITDPNKLTVKLSEGKSYAISFHLFELYPILFDNLPDKTQIRMQWRIDGDGPGYETPKPYSVIDYYSGGDIGVNSDLIESAWTPLDFDGTGKWSVEDCTYEALVESDYHGRDMQSFRPYLYFQGFKPMSTGTYTFSIKSVEVYMIVPVTVGMKQDIYKLQMEQQSMAEQQEITNEKLDDMPEQIGDEMQGVLDKEKEEVSNAGEGAAGELLEIIPDQSDGFMSAVQSLVGAMSYNGTDAKLPIPPIKIPAIKGVMNEIKLTDMLEVDFGYWVNQLPSGVLQLVRVLGTLALIVYCFKELYAMIAYALTLKGGGSGE